jgi:hypothetical protein
VDGLRLLIQSAGRYRKPPRLGTTLARRQRGQDRSIDAAVAFVELFTVSDERLSRVPRVADPPVNVSPG